MELSKRRWVYFASFIKNLLACLLLDDIFMSATTPGNQGDSGAGVYSANEGRFIGMVTGKRIIDLIGDYSDTKFVNAYPSILKFTGKLEKVR
jgi:hypothetical protein